ncbi:hypothetical protein Plec18167_003956 [Paecilomyces lecythidis]|uniref:Uncharacterized protein n=1 Tax=Paecilomyces lecythidis TaxID=3004212 RepID=A0ABR3XVD1_9EURO
MGVDEVSSAPVAITAPGDDKNIIKVQDADELRLAQMGRRFLIFRKTCMGLPNNFETGHKQELARHFSVFSLIGLASTCTISWTGMLMDLDLALLRQSMREAQVPVRSTHE